MVIAAKQKLKEANVHRIVDYYISEDFTKEETLGHHLGKTSFTLNELFWQLPQYDISYVTNVFQYCCSKIFYLKYNTGYPKFGRSQSALKWPAYRCFFMLGRVEPNIRDLDHFPLCPFMIISISFLSESTVGLYVP